MAATTTARFDLDTRAFRAALERLGKRRDSVLLAGLRKGANIIKKEVSQDYQGRVLHRRSGKTAKSWSVRKGRTRGTELSMVVQSKNFVARLHESGYTLNPVIKNAKQFGDRVGRPVHAFVGGRWVTLKSRTRVPGKHVLERQMDKQETRVWQAVRQSLHDLIVKAGLG